MAKVDLTKLKNDAQKFLTKGKLDKALEAYQELEKHSKGDPKVTHKVAEILHKLGKKTEAIAKYKDAAQSYLDKGFLVQAIAINKVILGIDPNEPEAKARLEELTNKRVGGAAPALPLKKTPEPETRKPAPITPPPPTEEPAGPAVPEYGNIELPGESEEAPAPAPAAVDAKSEFEQLPAEQALEALEEGGKEEPVPVDDAVEPLDLDSEAPESGPARTPLFSDLEPEAFKRVFEIMRHTTIPAGIAICREGDKGDSIFVIVEGKVAVSRKDAEGHDRQVKVLGPNEFFGEFGYFANATRQATVKALTKVKLLELSKAQMDEVCKEFPAVREVLLKFYRERVLDNLLAFSPMFQTLSPEERGHLVGMFRPVSFAPGAVVVKEGDPGDSMFILKSGEVEVTTLNPLTQERVVLARLHSGDFFGEVSLIKKKPRTATITALSPVEAMELTRVNFEMLTRAHPEITHLLEETIEKRVEDTIQLVTKRPGEPSLV